MSTDRYKRIARLSVGEVQITQDDLRISFEINRSMNESRDSTVSVTNLSAATAARIESNAVFELYAGYEGFDGLLIRGAISNVNSRREGTERITTITVAAGKDRSELYFEKSYDEGATLHLVLQDIAELMEVKLGDTSIVPNDPVENLASSVSVAFALDSLLEQRGITWMEEDGFLQFVPLDFEPGTAGTGTYTVNEEVGMKGTPTVTDEGAQVTVLLDPRIRIRSGIILESEAISGTFRVTEMIHRGDTWTGPFDTELTVIR